jgi:leucyl aminopeptidase
MEQRIREIAKDHANVKEIRTVDHNKLQQLGMNLFYNVGKGATIQPRCVIVHYVGDPSRANEVDFAFVGKGITYDTGGLNIKGTGFMEDMYGDKGGACAIIGALKGTLERGSNQNIIFSCALAENAIGSAVYKPGDIIVGLNGLSVEIGNTDAEGRLVLSDTITYV